MKKLIRKILEKLVDLMSIRKYYIIGEDEETLYETMNLYKKNSFMNSMRYWRDPMSQEYLQEIEENIKHQESLENQNIK